MKPFELVNGTYLPKRKAIIFVDYEYWYYSYLKQFRTVPDVTGWFSDILDVYDPVETFFFGAFTQEDLQREIPKIRSVTNSIVTTETAGKFHKKDTTDFIMLDFIYQQAASQLNSVDYVIFTGDGHFHSVVKFLRFKLMANVLICGVKDTISYQLQTAANEVVEYSGDNGNVMQLCYRWIVNNFEFIRENPERNILPTFNGVTTAVSIRNNVDESLVKVALQRMVDLGYLTREETTVGEDNHIIKILVPNWELIRSGQLILAES